MPPDCAAAVDVHDLGGENADDSALNGGGGAGAGLGGDKSEIPPTGGDFAEKGQDVDDGAVVEGDRVMITALQRVDLRPAAGGELGDEEVVEPRLKAARCTGFGEAAFMTAARK